MKKFSLLCFALILCFQSKSQVVFCPAGAEWHYLFSGSIFSPGNTYNEQIKYTGDSIEGLDTLKILTHTKFFMECSPTVLKTYVKQIGDSIFFKNSRTQNAWQILYNFSATQGQSWQTTVLRSNNVLKTFTFTVDTSYVTSINGFNLKQLHVISEGVELVITERLGNSIFLFPYQNSGLGSCDGPGILESLCYKDDVFGLKQFGEKSCDYKTSNSVGVNELEQQFFIKIFPNPVNNILMIEIEGSVNSQLSIIDITGKELRREEFENRTSVDVSDLESGIYFVSIKRNGKMIQNTKFIKE
jgi:hypothetical protein